MSLCVPARSFLAAVVAVLGLSGVTEARDEGDRRVLRQRQDERSAGYERRHGHSTHRGVPDYRVVVGRSFGTRAEHDRRIRRDRWPHVVGWSAPASVIVGSSRFSGDVASWYASGGGSYFTLKRYGSVETVPLAGAGSNVRSRIIRVDRHAGDRACSVEAGVCVIRGR